LNIEQALQLVPEIPPLVSVTINSIGYWDSRGGVDSMGWVDRSTLASTNPSIAPSSINDIKTTEVPLILRVRVLWGIIEGKESWGLGLFRSLGLL
jgi:hypothetical protein